MPWRKKSYDELPALSVRGLELRRSMRLVTVAWMFGVVWMSCISGSQFITFARMMGLEDFGFGVLQALPFIATFGQFFAAILIERTGLRKYQFMTCATIGRSLWMVLAMVPLVIPIPSPAAVWAMMSILMVIYFMDALASPAWLTWMGYLIPRRIRGRYFAVRAQITQIVQIIVVIAVGILMDYATVKGAPENQPWLQPVLLYSICGILIAGSLFGMADILLFRNIREVMPPAYVRSSAPVMQMLLEPLKDRVFRHYVAYGAAFTFTTTIGAMFFWRTATEVLHFSKLATNVMFLVIVPVTGILVSHWWGRLIDRWGRRPVLIIGGVGTAVATVSWLLASPNFSCPDFVLAGGNALAGWLGGLLGYPHWQWFDPCMPVTSYLIVLVGTILGGIAWSGVALAQTGVILGFADGEGKSTSIAAASVLISIGGAAGALIGGLLASVLEPMHANPWTLGPFIWNNWHVLFALAIVGRLLSLILLKGMPDPGAASVRDLLRYMRSNVSNNVLSMVFYPLRVFGWRRWGEGRGRDEK